MAQDKIELEHKEGDAAKAGIAFTVAVFLTKALSFITVPIFTRLMSKAEFGAFNTCTSWQLILLTICGLEGYATLSRARFDYDEDGLTGYQSSVLVLGAAIALVFIACLAFAPAAVEAAVGVEARYLWPIAGYLLFYPAFSMFQSWQMVRYRWRSQVILTTATTFASMALAVALVVLMPNKLMGRFVGHYLPFTLVGAVLFFRYLRDGRGIRISDLRYALPVCAPLMLAAASSHLLGSGNRIVVQHMADEVGVAYLSLAMMVANIVTVIVSAVYVTWSPWLMDCLYADDRDRARSSFTALAWIVCAIVVSCGLLAPELTAILGGAGYAEAIPLIPSCATVCLLSFIATQYLLVETYHKDVWGGAAATFGAAVIHVLVCIAIMRFWGVAWVGFAGIVSQGLLIAVHSLICARMGERGLFGARRILSPIIVCCAMIPVELLLASNGATAIRWILFAATAAAALIPAAKIVRALRSA